MTAQMKSALALGLFALSLLACSGAQDPPNEPAPSSTAQAMESPSRCTDCINSCTGGSGNTWDTCAGKCKDLGECGGPAEIAEESGQQ